MGSGRRAWDFCYACQHCGLRVASRCELVDTAGTHSQPLHIALQQESDVHWVRGAQRGCAAPAGRVTMGQKPCWRLTSSSTLNMRMRMRFWDAEYW